MRCQVRVLGHVGQSSNHLRRRRSIEIATEDDGALQAREVVEKEGALLVVRLYEVTSPRQLIPQSLRPRPASDEAAGDDMNGGTVHVERGMKEAAAPMRRLILQPVATVERCLEAGELHLFHVAQGV